MELTPDLLLRAYAVGIFPMAESRLDPKVHWIDPDTRGILPLEHFHIPRKLRQAVRRKIFDVRCDTAFEAVIEACAEPAGNRPDSWINPTIRHLYTELYHLGFAHSIECWREGGLVGGLYGVSLGGAFFGESMFSRHTDASKVALVHLMLRLRKGSFRLLDTQFTTPHLRQFGAIEITRREYRTRLVPAITAQARFPREVSDAEVEAFLQSVSGCGFRG
jgi:leucyl/phenylalanyl-tRNA--protein transferase